MNNAQADIVFVVPLFNEAAVFQHLVERLDKIMENSDLLMQVIFVDDGSSDSTPELISQLALQNSQYCGVFLSRNYGHQIALSAGLREANPLQAVMIIDGDLQDPPECFFEFYERFKQGYDVVFGVRKKRKEGFLKKAAYFSFYRIIKRIASVDIPLDSGDFSLLSKRALVALNAMPEESRFIRGMRSWIGFKQIGVVYERPARLAGDSKYSIGMLFKLAYNGFFNFSEYPIKFIQKLGFVSIAASFIYLITIITKKLFWGTVPEGFVSLLFMIIFFSGVQLIAIGIIGEYVLRIFFQVKKRPLFIIEKKIVNKQYVNGI